MVSHGLRETLRLVDCGGLCGLHAGHLVCCEGHIELASYCSHPGNTESLSHCVLTCVWMLTRLLRRKNFSLKERQLSVRDMTWVFDPVWNSRRSSVQGQSEATVYGKRDGMGPGLCIVSANAKNLYRSSKGYRTGVVLGVPMLQRADMVKPETVAWFCLRRVQCGEKQTRSSGVYRPSF